MNTDYSALSLGCFICILTQSQFCKYSVIFWSRFTNEVSRSGVQNRIFITRTYSMF